MQNELKNYDVIFSGFLTSIENDTLFDYICNHSHNLSRCELTALSKELCYALWSCDSICKEGINTLSGNSKENLISNLKDAWYID